MKRNEGRGVVTRTNPPISQPPGPQSCVIFKSKKTKTAKNASCLPSRTYAPEAARVEIGCRALIVEGQRSRGCVYVCLCVCGVICVRGTGKRRGKESNQWSTRLAHWKKRQDNKRRGRAKSRGGKEGTLVKYLVASATQLALPLVKQPFAHLAGRLHEFFALVANLVARRSKSAGRAL
jgi:hypothetical protein